MTLEERVAYLEERLNIITPQLIEIKKLCDEIDEGSKTLTNEIIDLARLVKAKFGGVNV